MLTEFTFNSWNKLFIYFFSFLWHKILVLIFNMFLYAKVGHSSKLVEMHTDALDFYWSIPVRLVFYTHNQVKNCDLFIELLYIQSGAIKNILWTTVFYSIVEISFKVWQIIITAFTSVKSWVLFIVIMANSHTN